MALQPPRSTPKLSPTLSPSLHDLHELAHHSRQYNHPQPIHPLLSVLLGRNCLISLHTMLSVVLPRRSLSSFSAVSSSLVRPVRIVALDQNGSAAPSEPFITHPFDIDDGKDAHTLFGGGQGYTYDDLILLPGHIDFAADAVDLSTQLTKNIRLHVPFVSSPMDTVTESSMAIAMALQGGIGIIHYNCSIEEQGRMVDRVKRYKNGFITDPKTLRPDHTIADVLAIKTEVRLQRRAHHGVGRHVRQAAGHGDQSGTSASSRTRRRVLSDIMTPLSDLVIAQESCTLEEANDILKGSKKAKLPIVNAEGRAERPYQPQRSAQEPSVPERQQRLQQAPAMSEQPSAPAPATKTDSPHSHAFGVDVVVDRQLAGRLHLPARHGTVHSSRRIRTSISLAVIS